MILGGWAWAGRVIQFVAQAIKFRTNLVYVQVVLHDAHGFWAHAVAG